MKNFKTHKQQTWWSVFTILYGISLVFSYTTLRIIEFPWRIVLIIFCFGLPTFNLIALGLGHLNIARYGLVLLSPLWGVIGLLYFLNPIPNAGWLLSIAIVVGSWIALYENDGEPTIDQLKGGSDGDAE